MIKNIFENNTNKHHIGHSEICYLSDHERIIEYEWPSSLFSISFENK